MRYKLMKSDNPDIVLTVLENRDLTIDGANEIISPSIEEYSPFLLKNIEEGINSLKSSLAKKIGVIIDSDADGYCSSAMIINFLEEYLEVEVTPIFHTKNVKSHGVDNEVFDFILENKIEYVICPDSSSSLEDYRKIKVLAENNNVEFLILDHHEVEWPTELNNTTLINIHQQGDIYPNKCLSGAAVTYKFIKAYAESENINIGNKYIDLAAITLISDMMDMRELENRVIYNKGSIYENITSPLIHEFIINKKLNKDKITIENIAFSIASLINATIRSSKQNDKELLLESFYKTGFTKSNKRGNLGAMEDIQVETLRRLSNNKMSQDKPVKEATEKLIRYIHENNLNDSKILMVDVEGVLDRSATGLVANKLLSEYKKPIMLYRTKHNDDSIVGGSARITGVNNFKDICENSKLFEFASGHQSSFGFEIKKEKMPLFIEMINDTLKDVEFDSTVEVDAAYNQIVPLQDVIDIADMNDLWCNQIKEPKFIIQDVEIDTSKILKIGNATYSFKIGDMSFTKNFGSKVFIENFAKQEMYDKKEKFPFRQQTILADLLVRFRKNAQGYAYIDIIDTESKII